jgi:L-alanine-DL-glutamate epimerase-like enolase superfamily enzyme
MSMLTVLITASRRCKAAKFLAASALPWFEEPGTYDDRVGLHLLVENAPPQIRIAAGEYIYVLDDARLLVEAQAVDVLQLDVTRCGGISNFLKISDLAEICLLAFICPYIHNYSYYALLRIPTRNERRIFLRSPAHRGNAL